MSEHAAAFVRPIRGSRWSDRQSRDALQAIAEGVAEVAGFDLVGISVARDDGYLQALVIVGPDEARAVLVDSLAPTKDLLEQLETAEDWGALKFIPHDRLTLDIEKWGWFSDAPRDEVAPGGWHPEDMLLAPLESEDGAFIGFLGMEMPRDGLVPSADKRQLLEVYARQAGRAVVTTLERERLAEQVRLAGAAADVVRRATATMSAGEVLAACGAAIVDGFRAAALWSQLLGDQPQAVHDSTPVPPPAALIELLGRYAAAAWEQQTVGVFAPDRRPPEPLTGADVTTVLSFLGSTGAGAESLLVVPLGAGPECLGWLALTRAAGGAEWSDVEAAAALDIGRDLGGALATAQMFERERELVRELQGLADYKGRLVATVSHELKNPLSAILGYVEILDSEPGLSDSARSCVAAIRRGGGRLTRVVDDLLLLHEVDDLEASFVAVPVDLRAVVEEVLDFNAALAAGSGVTLVADCAATAPLALGDPRELDHVVTNLVSNAIKYTPTGGTVTVSLTAADDEVVLSVSDDGIGISADDQQHLFEEFFRSSDPAAVAQPGTGLGLAIARRVVLRHRGRIEVDSVAGGGSTFRVHLPAG